MSETTMIFKEMKTLNIERWLFYDLNINAYNLMTRSGSSSLRSLVMVWVILALALDTSTGSHMAIHRGSKLIEEHSWLLPIQSEQAHHPTLQSNFQKLSGWSTSRQHCLCTRNVLQRVNARLSPRSMPSWTSPCYWPLSPCSDGITV